MGVDPIAQSDFLFVGEVAAAAFVVEGLQRFDPASLKSPMPVANRVVVQQQGRRDPLAAPVLVEKDDRVRPAGHAMLRKAIPGKPGQGSPVVSREKAAANHTEDESHPPETSRGFSRFLIKSGYSREIGSSAAARERDDFGPDLLR